MENRGYLIRLRLELDDAITYGTKKEAMRLAREGLKLAGSKNLEGEVEYFRGQVELLKGNYASAIEYFDAAIKCNPDDGASYNERALCMVELGIIDEALEYFDKGIKVEPDFATIYHNKGWLLNNIGRYQEAISCFKKALNLQPNRAVTYDNVADALYNLGDLPGAIAAYKKVLKYLLPGRSRGLRSQIKSRIRLIEGGLKDADH